MKPTALFSGLKDTHQPTECTSALTEFPVVDAHRALAGLNGNAAGYQIGVEITAKSVPLEAVQPRIPSTLVVGGETSGADRRE